MARYGDGMLGEEAMERWASAADVSPARSSVNQLYGEERRKVAQAVECWSGKKTPRPVLQVRTVVAYVAFSGVFPPVVLFSADLISLGAAIGGWNDAAGHQRERTRGRRGGGGAGAAGGSDVAL